MEFFVSPFEVRYVGVRLYQIRPLSLTTVLFETANQYSYQHKKRTFVIPKKIKA